MVIYFSLLWPIGLPPCEIGRHKDLKSLGRNTVPVQVRLAAPSNPHHTPVWRGFLFPAPPALPACHGKKAAARLLRGGRLFWWLLAQPGKGDFVEVVPLGDAVLWMDVLGPAGVAAQAGVPAVKGELHPLALPQLVLVIRGVVLLQGPGQGGEVEQAAACHPQAAPAASVTSSQRVSSRPPHSQGRT